MEKTDYKYYLSKITDSMIYYTLPVLVFFAPIKGICITVILFVILDTITGIWKAKHNKNPITSKGLYSFVKKSLIYQAFILTTFTFGYFILDGAIDSITGIKYTMTKLVSMILMYIEVKSINENYEAITGVNLGQELVDMITNIKGVSKKIKEKDEEGNS